MTKAISASESKTRYLTVEREHKSGGLAVEQLYKRILTNSGQWCLVMYITRQNRPGRSCVRATFNRYQYRAGNWRQSGSISMPLDAVKQAAASVDEFMEKLEKEDAGD